MTFIYRKIRREDWNFSDLHESIGTVCELTRRMPDGQKFASVFYLAKNIDRKETADIVRMQKDEVRRRTDHEWKYGALKGLGTLRALVRKRE